jgi:hypothetical protein
VTSRNFIIVSLAGIALVAGVVVPLNMYVDLYGLYRPVKGRALSIYGEERTAKYLHSFRYIPENFDGVLLGSSVSDNFNTKEFAGHRVYNASINGGNVADLMPIAINVFRTGELKLAIVCIHRYLTLDHAPKTDLMNPRQYWAALGSPQLLTAYLSLLAAREGLVRRPYDDRGTLLFGADTDSQGSRKTIEKTLPGIRRGTESVGNYSIDPVALAQLNDVIRIARRGSRQLILFHPPTPESVLELRSDAFAHYRDTINALARPGDIVVDFNGAGYADLRSDYNNFVDAVHLSARGGQLVIRELGRIVAANANLTVAAR